MVFKEASKGMGDEEEAYMDFNRPVRMDVDYTPTTPYLPNENYRPRKSLYLDLVHTGYNWSKFNRTRYYHNIPPTKMVQGYKFNFSILF